MGVSWANTTARRFALVAACAALAAAGMAAGSPARAPDSHPNPPLARLEIDIWPEYDRASAVLVILRGEIAADAALPAEVSVRIPTSSGGPIAVAEAPTATDQLLELPYQRADVQVDFMTINFSATNRFIHVEFYDPLKTESPARAYKYLWPGDFSAAQVTLQVQEPAGGVRGIGEPGPGRAGPAIRWPTLPAGGPGRSRTGEGVGGRRGYQRTETRTSADILAWTRAAASSPGESKWTTTRLLVLGGMGVAAALLVATSLVL